jgi:hypothetical protein
MAHAPRPSPREWDVRGAGHIVRGPGPAGTLLFQLVRDVEVWGTTSPEERARLFRAGARRTLNALLRAAGTDARLKPKLRTLVQMTHAPEADQDEPVAQACRDVAQWADEHEFLATAAEFAQAAAVLTPADAALSYAVGRLAQRRGEYARAETWYRRAITLARGSGDWTAYAQAFIALGRLYMQRGNLRAARPFLVRGARAARANSLHKIEGRALHELFVVAIWAEQPEENVQQLARAALEAYGPGHERVIYLAWNLAEFWLEHGPAPLALMLFQAIVRHAPDDAARARAYAGLARAAARLGERQLNEEAWENAWERLSAPQLLTNDDVALQDLAAAAAGLGDEERAARAAERISQFIRVPEPFSRSRPTRPPAKDHDEPAHNAEPDDVDQAHVLAVDLVRTIEAAQPAS